MGFFFIWIIGECAFSEFLLSCDVIWSTPDNVQVRGVESYNLLSLSLSLSALWSGAQVVCHSPPSLTKHPLLGWAGRSKHRGGDEGLLLMDLFTNRLIVALRGGAAPCKAPPGSLYESVFRAKCKKWSLREAEGQRLVSNPLLTLSIFVWVCFMCAPSRVRRHTVWVSAC